MLSLVNRVTLKRAHELKRLINFKCFAFGRLVSLKLPDLGEGTKEATIKQWYKKEGDNVEEEEKIVEVSTDKLVAELPSPGKGKISKINYKLEEACLVGKSLCEIEIEVDDKIVVVVDNSNKAAEVESGLGVEDILRAEDEERNTLCEQSNKSSPAVRYLLKEHNIHPKMIVPTGKGNRIQKSDVLDYIKNLSNPVAPRLAQVPVEKPIVQTVNISQEDKVVKLVGFQKAMTKTMTQSTLIPSFLFTDEFNVDKLVKLRAEMNRISSGKMKISYMPFFLKAVSFALLEFPQMNSLVNQKLGEDGYIYEYTIKKDHNLSIAIDSADGLVVPNIKRVQDKSISQIQQEIYELRAKTEAKKLTSEDLTGGSFTISNIGNIGGKVLNPVILPPQTCIIGISKFFDAVSVIPRKGNEHEDSQAYCLVERKDVAVIFNKSVNLCISADHRIIDGATVARFSEVLKTYIEHPLKIWIGK